MIKRLSNFQDIVVEGKVVKIIERSDWKNIPVLGHLLKPAKWQQEKGIVFTVGIRLASF